ncbi:hypothetical protein [Streptomyces gilvus]|uniref:hypothetical protein n=1 Tax=Streptomyces gilvus TaxID=2920937 RepID=UPI001F114C20|nr:hypothetical protein [Streptomyces sp. CME 23]MCH5674338.1 hypothetical protein [Streptomyces sp. CME 23]
MVTPSEGRDRDVVENIGADRPLLRERWQALSRRVRVTAAVSSGALALGALLAYAVATRPPPAPPDPVAATSVRITGVEMPQRYSLDFGITVRIASASPVTFTGTRQGYDGFLQPLAARGAVLPPGHALVLHTRVNVYCQLPLPSLGTPLLFVTVRNARREGQAPVVPTAAQFADISRAVQRICVH